MPTPRRADTNRRSTAWSCFPRQQVVGVFRGFREGGLEFHADLALPYRNDFQRIPMHGQFVLVQLETPEEAVLGRIASFSSEGKLSYRQWRRVQHPRRPRAAANPRGSA